MSVNTYYIIYNQLRVHDLFVSKQQNLLLNIIPLEQKGAITFILIALDSFLH